MIPDPKDSLRSTGLRATPQRVRLLELLGKEKGPVSVEALVAKGKGAFDVTTAYRTLGTLVGTGLARRIELDAGRALFELANEHHHHAVCTSCGAIRDISACLPASFEEKARNASGFASIERHSLEFFGLCARCA